MTMISYEIESIRHERQGIEYFFYRSSNGNKDKKEGRNIQINNQRQFPRADGKYEFWDLRVHSFDQEKKGKII